MDLSIVFYFLSNHVPNMRMITIKDVQKGMLQFLFLGAHQVYHCYFWMWHYGSKTPKRTALWSSSPSIGLFWTRKLKKVLYEKERKARGRKPRPCRTYKDAEGRTRYHGTSELKSTEFPGWKLLGGWTLHFCFFWVVLAIPVQLYFPCLED